MKIAFLSFYSGAVYRGVETYVHELANRLKRNGNDVTVYQVGSKLPEAVYKTVTINVKTNWNKKSSYFPFLNYYGLRVKYFTSKTLSEIDRDTDILVPTNGQWQSLLCSIWAKTRGKKIVISGQSGPGLDDRINIWTFPNAFIGLTSYQCDWARKANPFVDVQGIPNGVDMNKFQAEGSTLRLKLPGPIILNVAALQDWKRQDLAIRAVAKLKNGSLLLIGQGDQEENLRTLGDSLLPGRFKIMSFKHEDMPAVFKAANLFTFPTVPWESFGIAIVEAMASGLPVVATNDPIRREIVGDAGILVDPSNTDEYAAALKKALETNWGNKPRKQAEKFDWDKITEKYEELFRKLLTR